MSYKVKFLSKTCHIQNLDSIKLNNKNKHTEQSIYFYTHLVFSHQIKNLINFS